MNHLEAARVMTAGCLCFRARRVSRTITRLYDEALRPVGLQATQLTLLNAIAMGGDAGNLMPAMADVLAMDPTTLSRNLKPLENDGLVAIERSPGDRRVRVAKLTAAGRAKVAEALPLWQAATDRLIDVVGPEFAADLRARFDDTVAHLAQRRAAISAESRLP